MSKSHLLFSNGNDIIHHRVYCTSNMCYCFVTMLYYNMYFIIILVNIDQDQMKLVLVNITKQEKQINIEENRNSCNKL